MSTPAEDNINVVDDENSGFNKGAKGGLGARRAVGPRGLSAYQFACFVAIYDAIRVMKVSNLLSILYKRVMKLSMESSAHQQINFKSNESPLKKHLRNHT